MARARPRPVSSSPACGPAALNYAITAAQLDTFADTAATYSTAHLVALVIGPIGTVDASHAAVDKVLGATVWGGDPGPNTKGIVNHAVDNVTLDVNTLSAQ